MSSIVVLCSYLHLLCLSAANGQALLQVSKYTLHLIRLTFFVGSMLCVDSCPEVVDFARVFFRTPNRAVDVTHPVRVYMTWFFQIQCSLLVSALSSST